MCNIFLISIPHNFWSFLEHSKSTILNLVGLQVWRGALLLADWLICNNENLPDKTILELGSGVGLTSIVASMYKPVLCTGKYYLVGIMFVLFESLFSFRYKRWWYIRINSAKYGQE